MESKLGIEYNVFEYGSGIKKTIFKFRAAPGNIKAGLQVMESKLGINLDKIKEQQETNRKRIREGTIKRR